MNTRRLRIWLFVVLLFVVLLFVVLLFVVLLVVVLLVGFGASLFVSASMLPERVATHFNAAGQPNGWMKRSIHLWCMAAFGVLFPLFLIVICWGTEKEMVSGTCQEPIIVFQRRCPMNITTRKTRGQNTRCWSGLHSSSPLIRREQNWDILLPGVQA